MISSDHGETYDTSTELHRPYKGTFSIRDILQCSNPNLTFFTKLFLTNNPYFSYCNHKLQNVTMGTGWKYPLVLMEVTRTAIGATDAKAAPDKDTVVAQWRDGFARHANMIFVLSVFQ